MKADKIYKGFKIFWCDDLKYWRCAGIDVNATTLKFIKQRIDKYLEATSLENLHPPKEYKLKILIDKGALLKIERECAQILSQRKSENVVVLVMMNGAFIFASDILRMVNWKGKVLFVNASSYVGTKQNEKVKVGGIDYLDVKGKHIIILEDIIDSGKTMTAVAETLKKLGAEKVEVLTMLLREGKGKPSNVDIMNYGLKLESNIFVVGYGLDFNDKYRGLDYLGYLVAVVN